MAFSFLQLKQTVRQQVWPAGEARSRRPAHDKWFLDCLMEIQRYVECFQQNNTDLFPHCSTFYNCGLTSFDFSRAMIKKLSVVNAPGKVLADITQTDTDVFKATESLQSDTWPGYPNTINNGINSVFAPVTIPPNVQYDYGTPTIVTAYAIDMICQEGASQVPFLLEGSNDSSTWSIVDARMVDLAADAPRNTLEVTFENATAYRFYRLSVGAAGDSFATTFGALGFFYGLTFTGYKASDLAGPIDWCSEIPYDQVDFCHVERYLGHSARAGCCMPLHLWFGLPQACLFGKGPVPVPTDAGLPPGLAVLPLGYKYPQTSTDYKRRAFRGVWANDRGRIYIAPWIQSTETVVLKWDGIKRSYSDDDPVDPDPQFVRAVKLFVEKESERHDNRDYEAADRIEQQFNVALQGLWKDCHDETTVRGCEGSKARAASPIVALFYNDARSYTAVCPTGQTGDSVTSTIDAGTVSSSISKQDANNLAAAQAQADATARLHCITAPKVYHNRAVTGHASCVQEEGSPPPDGSDVDINIAANDPRFDSTLSEDAATAAAQQEADRQAAEGLSCTFWNRFQTYTAQCPAYTSGPDVTKTRAAHTVSSGVSQTLADDAALNEAKLEAEEGLVCDALPAASFNTDLGNFVGSRFCTRKVPVPGGFQICNFTATVTVTITAHHYSSLDGVGAANQIALDRANAFINSALTQICATYPCADVSITKLNP